MVLILGCCDILSDEAAGYPSLCMVFGMELMLCCDMFFSFEVYSRLVELLNFEGYGILLPPSTGWCNSCYCHLDSSLLMIYCLCLLVAAMLLSCWAVVMS